jgi:intracellular sulfur oxidation DsrE/DsrF family protein
VVRDPEKRSAAILAEQTGIAEVETLASVALDDGYTRLRVTLGENEAPLAVGERLSVALVTAGIAVASLSAEAPTLEQVFAELTQDGNEAR